MRFRGVILIPTALLLASCAVHAGHDFSIEDAQKIERGKTTKEEIHAKFGEPQVKVQSSQGETWNYNFGDEGFVTPFWVFGAQGRAKSLSIVFEGNLVKDFHWTSTEPNVGRSYGL